MLRFALALGVVVNLVHPCLAQDLPNPPSAKEPGATRETARPLNPTKGDRQAGAKAGYQIELAVLEGPGLAAYRSSQQSTGEAAGEKGRKLTFPGEWKRGGVEAGSVLPNPPSAGDSLESTRKEIALADELWAAAGHVEGITRIAAPKLVVIDGPASVQIQGTQKFSYLVPLGSGKFEAKQTEAKELGITLSLHLQPVEGNEDSVEVSPLTIEVSALDGREPVEGLDLEVGKPIIASRSLRTTAQMKLGTTRLIEIPAGAKKLAVLLLRVNRFEFEGKP